MDKVEFLKELAAVFHSFADGLLAAIEDAEKAQPQQPAEESQPTVDVAAQPPEAEKPELTLEQVRAVLAEKSRAGHTADVRALLKKHGSSKLSSIDPAEYPALLADVEAL